VDKQYDPWKRIPLENCGGASYERDSYYALPGYFLAELAQMAALLSSGERIDADDRRDMAQKIQAVMNGHKEIRAFLA
jgi:hypothetical protein